MTTGFGVLTSEDFRAELDRATEQRLAHVRPEIRSRVMALLARANAAGITLCVTQGYRSPQDQDALYAKGRTVISDVPCRHAGEAREPGSCEEHPLGATVTRAKAGESWHEWGLAVDVAVLDADHRPSWPEDDALWRRIGEMGEDLDLQWGGRFRNPDRPHFQMTLGLHLALMKSGDQVLPPLGDVEEACLPPSSGPEGPRPPIGTPGIPATASASSSGKPPSGSVGPATPAGRTVKSA